MLTVVDSDEDPRGVMELAGRKSFDFNCLLGVISRAVVSLGLDV